MILNFPDISICSTSYFLQPLKPLFDMRLDIILFVFHYDYIPKPKIENHTVTYTKYYNIKIFVES